MCGGASSNLKKIKCHHDGCRLEAPFVKECQAGVCRGKIVPLLYGISRAITTENDLAHALDCLLDYMQENMGIPMAMINLYHRKSGGIFIHKSIGLTEEERSKGVYFRGEGVTGWAMESAKPIVVPRIGSEPAFLNRTGVLSRSADPEHAFLCVPIMRGEKVLGSISAMRHYGSEELLERHFNTLIVISDILAQSVELYLVESIDKVQWEQRNQELNRQLQARYKPSNIVGSSRPMMEVFSMVHKVAQTRTTVLLLGESGVGKELIANAIHYDGINPDGPMVMFNCAALPESILESELFGHEKGAFTGATQLRKGRFEEADGGTIFLDEIGELSLSVQAKLLRVLQERTFERVGGGKPVTVNIRVIAATNRDLSAMVAASNFRQDLYFRLNVFPIMIPPLRDRGSDIITLAEHFVARFARENNKEIKRMATPVINMLMSYSWPGNVRELENAMERAVILSDDGVIHAYHLPLSMQSPVIPQANMASNLEARLAAVEYEMLVETLALHKGNVTKAANELKLTRRAMGLRMAKYDLDYRKFRSEQE